MPDLEPFFRNLRLHLAPDEQARKEIRAYHRGLDAARKEIAIFLAVVAGVAMLIAWVAI